MELLGTWTGVCYYKSTRAFVLDNTMKLSILLSDERGNLRGIVTEICEHPGLFHKKRGKDFVEENIFRVRGSYEEADGKLCLHGVCEQKGRRMSECVLELSLNEEQEKLEGIFRNPGQEEDAQLVELHKGDVRRDLKELQEMGLKFVEEMKRQDARRKKN